MVSGGGGVAGDDGVVDAVHALGDGAGALDVGLVEQQHLQGGVLLLGLDGGQWPGGAAADHQDVDVEMTGRGGELGHGKDPRVGGGATLPERRGPS